jgi:hypothetical protein
VEKSPRSKGTDRVISFCFFRKQAMSPSRSSSLMFKEKIRKNRGLSLVQFHPSQEHLPEKAIRGHGKRGLVRPKYTLGSSAPQVALMSDERGAVGFPCRMPTGPTQLASFAGRPHDVTITGLKGHTGASGIVNRGASPLSGIPRYYTV